MIHKNIDKNINTIIKIEEHRINSNKLEYSLKQNLFDPSKSSPPNNFMEKLQKRMSIYNSVKPAAVSCS